VVKGLGILRIVDVSRRRPLTVFQASDGATRLLGMPGFLAGVQEVVGGEWVI
jgi:hypothetical protein